MTKVYFVRHAQSLFLHVDDRTRPLTEEGKKNCYLVMEALMDKKIDVIYSSPYKRCLDTIGAVAKLFHMPIKEDERLRERTKGANSSIEGMREKRWADHSFHEEGGESIEMVQSRNVEALKEILTKHEGKNIVIGTHGTALSSIINFYKPEFGCEDYIRIVNWMPYIVEMDFEGQDFVGMNEITHAE